MACGSDLNVSNVSEDKVALDKVAFKQQSRNMYKDVIEEARAMIKDSDDLMEKTSGLYDFCAAMMLCEGKKKNIDHINPSELAQKAKALHVAVNKIFANPFYPSNIDIPHLVVHKTYTLMKAKRITDSMDTKGQLKDTRTPSEILEDYLDEAMAPLSKVIANSLLTHIFSKLYGQIDPGSVVSGELQKNINQLKAELHTSQTEKQELEVSYKQKLLVWEEDLDNLKKSIYGNQKGGKSNGSSDQQKLKDLQSKLDKEKNAKELALKQKQALENFLTEKKNKVNKLNADIQKLLAEKIEHEENTKNLAENMTKQEQTFANEIALFKAKIQDLERDLANNPSKIDRLENEIRALIKDKEKLETNEKKIGTENEKQKKAFESEKATLQEEINRLKNNQSKKNKKHKESKEKNRVLEEEVKSKQQALDQQASQMEGVEKARMDLQEELSKLKEEPNVLKKNAKEDQAQKEELEKLKAENEAIKNSLKKNKDDNVAELKKEIEELRKKNKSQETSLEQRTQESIDLRAAITKKSAIQDHSEYLNQKNKELRDSMQQYYNSYFLEQQKNVSLINAIHQLQNYHNHCHQITFNLESGKIHIVPPILLDGTTFISEFQVMESHPSTNLPPKHKEEAPGQTCIQPAIQPNNPTNANAVNKS